MFIKSFNPSRLMHCVRRLRLNAGKTTRSDRVPCRRPLPSAEELRPLIEFYIRDFQNETIYNRILNCFNLRVDRKTEQ
jgi:hypothetical protein